jgi:hypothetical protein
MGSKDQGEVLGTSERDVSSWTEPHSTVSEGRGSVASKDLTWLTDVNSRS